MAKRVLITGARAAVALDLARDFCAAGWEVHLADCVTVRMARWSNVPLCHHKYPSPRQQGAAFQQKIMQLVEDHRIDLVIPACEEVFHLAAPSLYGQLGRRLFAPNITILRKLHDKFKFSQACAHWGLHAPESHIIESEAALATYATTSKNWVFKPCFSRFGDKALIAPQPQEFGRIIPSRDAPWLAQRLVQGEEVCFHAAAHHGTVVGFASYGSDWRLGGGARYAFEPLSEGKSREKHETLRAIASTLACRAEIHGNFACDVIFDGAGTPYLLECNPRATSGVHLLVGKGDFARAIDQGKAMPEILPRSAYLAPAMWLFGFPQAIRTGRFHDWRACLANGSDAISRRNDRAPIAGALIDAAQFFLSGARRNISVNAATTFDIEWNGEEFD